MQSTMTWRQGPLTGVLPPWRRIGLLAILAFEAAGAFVGGPALIASPDGRWMQIPLEEMHGAFPDFMIPGLLLTFLGVLNAVAFLALLRRMPSAWSWVGTAMVGFLIWFVVELAIMGAKSWAQAVWGVPVVLGLILARPLAKERLALREEA